MKINLEFHKNWWKRGVSVFECGSVRGNEDWQGWMIHFPFGTFEIEFLKN